MDRKPSITLDRQTVYTALSGLQHVSVSVCLSVGRSIYLSVQSVGKGAPYVMVEGP